MSEQNLILFRHVVTCLDCLMLFQALLRAETCVLSATVIEMPTV